MVGGPMDGANALDLNGRLLQLSSDAGLDPTDAARAAYLLIGYVFGFVAVEVADVHDAGPLPPEAERVAKRQRASAATASDRYPVSAAAATTMARYVPTARCLWTSAERSSGWVGPHE